MQTAAPRSSWRHHLVKDDVAGRRVRLAHGQILAGRDCSRGDSDITLEKLARTVGCRRREELGTMRDEAVYISLLLRRRQASNDRFRNGTRHSPCTTRRPDRVSQAGPPFPASLRQPLNAGARTVERPVLIHIEVVGVKSFYMRQQRLRQPAPLDLVIG